nr:type II toxin-antitoxin system RelE/ParE family toxin [Nitrosomonas sp.]
MKLCNPSLPIPQSGKRKSAISLAIRVYKFILSDQLILLAYRILNQDTIKLLTLGPHENFYRDLKRLKP